MSARPEKICHQFTGQREKQHAKRKLRRLRRRQERKDPENAGTRIRHFTRGWTD